MEEKKKKTIGFNIIKSDPTDGHGGFGAGALSIILNPIVFFFFSSMKIPSYKSG
jgi:hypothetical protein